VTVETQKFGIRINTSTLSPAPDRNQPQFLNCPTHSLVPTSTELSWFTVCKQICKWWNCKIKSYCWVQRYGVIIPKVWCNHTKGMV
jgi:hypothetical protein